MALPSQDKFYHKKLKDWKLPGCMPIFDQDEFVPTGELDTTYLRDPKRTDTCAWGSIPHTDILTRWFLASGPWIEKHIVNRWRKHVQKLELNDPRDAIHMDYGNLVGWMDVLACVAASFMLAATVAVLYFVHTAEVRIGLILLFGTLFALLLKLMAGSPSRGEVFGATAAFYAVAAVFLGSTSNGVTNI